MDGRVGYVFIHAWFEYYAIWWVRKKSSTIKVGFVPYRIFKIIIIHHSITSVFFADWFYLVQFLAFGLVYLIWGDWSNDGFLLVKKKKLVDGKDFVNWLCALLVVNILTISNWLRVSLIHGTVVCLCTQLFNYGDDICLISRCLYYYVTSF